MSHARTATHSICLDCRTLLEEGGSCDAGEEHRVVATDDEEARQQWLDAVWGPPTRRQRARQLAKAGGSGAGFAVIFESCSGADVIAPPGEILWGLVIVVVAFVAAMIYWLFTLVWRRIQAHRHRLAPRGATRKPPKLGRKTGLVGVVRAQQQIEAPGSKEPCGAYAVDLVADRHEASAVMLRHGRSGPLRIELDDGSLVEVPKGRARVEGLRKRIAADAELPKRIGIDPESPEAEHPLVPVDEVEECLVRDGDRVAIHGALEREPREGSYRGARWVYRPLGAVGLKVLE